MKTVRIRIAVAVDQQGHWNASGWSGEYSPAKDAAIDSALEYCGSGAVLYWVEADLPIPEAVVVQGEVKPA